MRTVLAYLILPVLVPITGSIVSAILMPFMVYLRRYQAELITAVGAVLDTTCGYFCAVVAAHYVFGLLGVDFGWIAVVLIVAMGTGHNIGRMRRFAGTPEYIVEAGYAIGTLLGCSAGTLAAIYEIALIGLSVFLMTPLLILAKLITLTKQPSFPFWQKVTSMPDRAYRWFVEDPDWLIFEPGSGQEKPSVGGFSGPYHLQVPSQGGRVIRLYVNRQMIEESQKRFMEEITT